MRPPIYVCSQALQHSDTCVVLEIEEWLTMRHSVPSGFQEVTVAVVLRNILKPTLAILSAVSRKSVHLVVLVLARYSSMSR